MTTPLLPTREQLRAVTLTPQQLKRDALVEALITANYQEFIAKMMAAFRSGASQLTYTTNSDTAARNLRKLLFEYGYWVERTLDPLRVVFSWEAVNPYDPEDQYTTTNFDFEPLN